MPDLNTEPGRRIGEEWYDRRAEELFTIIGLVGDTPLNYECEYHGSDIEQFTVDYFEDERAYRFVEPEAAWESES